MISSSDQCTKEEKAENGKSETEITPWNGKYSGLIGKREKISFWRKVIIIIIMGLESVSSSEH